jgi:hypothetical protein
VEALIKSTNGRRALRFYDREQDHFRVSVEGDGPQVTKGIWGYTYPAGVADLFEACARDWTGWSDVQFWESIEGDLRLDVRSSPMGHITIKVCVRDTSSAEGWLVEVPVFTEAGALDDIARQCRKFFGP